MRGVLVALEGGVTSWRAVKNWVTERRRMPSWAARRFANAIEARAQAGLALVVELRAYADDRDKQPRWLPSVHRYRAERVEAADRAAAEVERRG
jgi:hypothetical protein